MNNYSKKKWLEINLDDWKFGKMTNLNLSFCSALHRYMSVVAQYDNI